MSTERVRLQSRHWFGKTLAGTVLGFGLALALSGLFAWLGPDGIDGGGGKVQFNMWLIAPLWAGVLSLVYLFRTPLRAWLWLGAANASAFGLLWAVRLSMS
ncbi:hypothetical protein H9L17_01845 [Thermomonas brevis]|uniref:Uncharacterized protein n=1 Tax=Thermomonas brevis TaxID=215691 RepID=A0A7G9QUB3_9GAMM|nr:hypothetical protein [Thermomonas brevis]QNN46938.1 hypothetical protein H9L17_01845 [Thermomonas brevis]